VQEGLPIDGLLPPAIFRLPPPAITEPPLSLAERNIRRGVDFGLPSGQEVASYLTEIYGPIEQTPFDALFPAPVRDGFRDILEIDPSLGWRTPLWYYIIREAEFLEPGPHLGPVGGLIVAESLLGSLVESGQFGIDKLEDELSSAVEDPSTISTTPPGNPREIRTMAQLVNYVV
jgi:hypothetical protein